MGDIWAQIPPPPPLDTMRQAPVFYHILSSTTFNFAAGFLYLSGLRIKVLRLWAKITSPTSGWLPWVVYHCVRKATQASRPCHYASDLTLKHSYTIKAEEWNGNTRKGKKWAWEASMWCLNSLYSLVSLIKNSGWSVFLSPRWLCKQMLKFVLKLS